MNISYTKNQLMLVSGVPMIIFLGVTSEIVTKWAEFRQDILLQRRNKSWVSSGKQRLLKNSSVKVFVFVHKHQLYTYLAYVSFWCTQIFFPQHNSRKSDVRGENQAQFSLTKKEESQFSRFFFSKSLRSISFIFSESMQNTVILLSDFFQGRRNM